MIGQRISHYQILEKLGQGGMGEVYLAKDLSLDRKVALKFLPGEMESDPLANKRFLREARSAAALDHPFIAHIHEIGESEGRSFIAMEYVRGQTLQQKLAAGPLPLEEALQIAAEIAEALDEAHREGIIHRDLKPSNIMITPGGHAKVTDFGLAKPVFLADSVNAQNLMTGLTGTGIRLGTVPYMAPEQLRGEPLDTRCDIFPFGILLFEMVSGVHPFRRADAIETANSIIHDELPPVAVQDSGATELLGHLLRKMMAKNPDHRYQTAREIRADVLELLKLASLTRSGRSSPYGGRRGRVRYFTWLIPLLAVCVAGLLILRMLPSASPQQSARLELSIPNGMKLAHYYRQGIAVSPDGRYLAFVAGRIRNPYLYPDGSSIYLRPMDQWQSRPVIGTENGFQPFFSPDGRWLGFTQYDVTENRWFLRKVRVEGGEVVTLCECKARWGAVWSEDDSIILGNGSGGLLRVPATGGDPAELTHLDVNEEEVSHRLPSLLPGGKVVLYTSPAKNESLGKEARIFAQSLETGERVQVAEGWDGRYLPNGYVLFAQEGTVRAVPFDPKSMRPTGPDIPILENVTHSLFTVNPTLRTGAMQLGFSNTGVLAYAEGSVFPEIKGNVVWVDREGKETPLGVEPRNYFTIRISRDGSKVLLTTVYPPQDVWIYDLTRGTYRRQTFEGNNIYAIWGPGEEDFSFSSDAGGSRDLFRKQVDSGPTRLEILDPGAHDYHRPSAWSADGRMLALVEASQETSFDIILLEGSGKAVNILESRFSEQYPDFSPDGRWMVYSSNESGEYEIYVRAVDHGERATQISTGGGIEPAWSRDGTEIYYRMGRDFFAVPVRLRGDDVHPDRPVKLFDGDYGSSWAVRSYDVAPDGRFLLIKRPDEAALEEAIGQFFPSRIKVIVNWFAEMNFGTQ